MGSDLRLIIDGSAAFNQGAGIGRYARNIVAHAARHFLRTEITLWYAPSQRGKAPFADATMDMFPGQPKPRVRRAPFGRRRADQLWFRARIPIPLRLFAGPADLVYSPDFTAPPDGRVPCVVTIHDLAFRICPERAPEPLRRYLEAVVPSQIKSAARLIAVSETTKKDLVDRLGVSEDRIAVVPNGVEERFFSAPPLTIEERAALGVPATYLLTVGTIEPRKNHVNLFAALNSLVGRVDLPLVVAGKRGWEYEPILAAAEPLSAVGRVVYLDYVPEEMLPGLYAGAAAVVYPSWYEGFGLPVLEAMAAGVPIVAGDVPALREVGGDAILYTSPASVDAIANAIESALDGDNRGEPARQARRQRATMYRWELSGRALALTIADVAGRPDLVKSELIV